MREILLKMFLMQHYLNRFPHAIIVCQLYNYRNYILAKVFSLHFVNCQFSLFQPVLFLCLKLPLHTALGALKKKKTA